MGKTEVAVPRDLSNYLGLFKPRPSFLLTYTGLATYAYATGWADPAGMMVFFMLGSIATMGSNTLNNYFDRDTDALMSRTKNRPLPSGLIQPSYAFIIGVLIIVLSAAAFSIWFNPLSAGLVILGAAYYGFFYTVYLKRRTPMNTVIGGLAGALPVLAGWAAATGSVGTEATLFALIVFLWTPGHFWCLAIRFREDYRKARLPMLPSVTDIQTSIKWIISFNLLTAASIGLSILMIAPVIYRLLAFAASASIVISSLLIYRRQNETGAWLAYKISGPALGLVFIGLFLSFV